MTVTPTLGGQTLGTLPASHCQAQMLESVVLSRAMRQAGHGLMAAAAGCYFKVAQSCSKSASVTVAA
jgi:hypothetical protein